MQTTGHVVSSCCLSFAGLLLVAGLTYGSPIFVKSNASGANDGTSWTDAFNDLQDAIALAANGDSIWVAQGTYTPTSGTDRTATFELKNGVAILGGFSGSETSLAERDVVGNPTVLSGDIGLQGDDSDNSYNVMTGVYTDTLAVIDGFTVTKGNANGTVFDDQSGAAIMFNPGSATMRNMTFHDNHAAYEGGALRIQTATTVIENSVFTSNSASLGGAVRIGGGTFIGPILLTDVSFTGNSATDYGGALFVSQNTIIKRATFFNNHSDGQGGAACVSNKQTWFYDCEFTSNSARNGGAIWALRIHLENVSIDGNTASHQGGGLVLDSGLESIGSVIISNNSAANGGGVYLYTYPNELGNLKILFNSATNGGGIYVSGAGATISNLLLVGNTGTYGGGMYTTDGATPTVLNSTFLDNRASGQGGGMYNESSTPDIANTIMRGDSAAAGDEIFNSTAASPTIHHSLINGSGGSGAGWDPSVGVDGGGNKDADPKFIDENGRNLRLDAGSPCIEAGDNYVAGLPAVDLDGAPRIRGVVVDMGAYESSYYCPAGTVLYVDEDNPWRGNGGSWEEAYLEVQEALQMQTLCPSVTEIWVAEGTYRTTRDGDRSATFRLSSGLALYGGFSGFETSSSDRKPGIHPTVLTGEIGVAGPADNAYHVVTATGTDASAVFDGFVVTGGAADGAFPVDDRGGGMLNVEGSPTVANVVFTDNSAIEGGGMANFISHPIVVNCVFFANTATGFGGGMANANSDPTLTNLSFGGNTAASGGGLYNTGSNPVATNSIFYGNYAIDRPQVSNTSGDPVFLYSIIEGSGGSGSGWDPLIGLDGGNNLDVDPLFVDAAGGDLRLTSSSPAIDVGDNSAPNLASMDIDGNQRIIGVTVDLGPYEFGAGTAIDDVPANGSRLAIHTVYPNPFNPTVTLLFELDRRREITVSIYDVRGERVRQVYSGIRNAGTQRLVWNATDESGSPMASGVYFVEIRTSGWRDVRKITLVK